VTSPFGRVRTGQGHQLLFEISLDRDPVGSAGLGATAQGGLDAAGDQLTTDPQERTEATAQGVNDAHVRFVGAVRVGQEQNPGMQEFSGRGLAGTHQLFQLRPLLFGESHPILLHDSYSLGCCRLLSLVYKNRSRPVK
jgi:hypothetical protein